MKKRKNLIVVSLLSFCCLILQKVLQISVLFFLQSLLFFSSALAWTPIPYDAPGYEWMDQIVEEEFLIYNRLGISQKMVDLAWENCQFHPWFKRYQVVGSKVYGPDGPIKNLLIAMVETYPVPDLDFIYYQHDVLKSSFFKYHLTPTAPIFAGAKESSCKRAILFSDWYYDIKEEKQGWNFLIQAIDENRDQVPWEKKSEKLFWRGTPTDGFYTVANWHSFPRGRIVYDSHFVAPDWIDAAFSNFLPWITDDLEGLKRAVVASSFVSPVDHLAYKYQLIVDGVSCTYPGTQWRLFSGCLSMKQDSADQLFFSKMLISWVHFVPLRHDLSNAMDAILWAKNHDREARQIAENAKEFARTHLMPEHILLYCYKVLLKYASLCKGK